MSIGWNPIEGNPQLPRLAGVGQALFPSTLTQHPPCLQTDVVGERILFGAIALLPLWWILGIQVFVYPLVGWVLFWRCLQRPVRVPIPFGWYMWGGFACIWLISLLINLARGSSEWGRSVTALGTIFGIWLLALVVWYAMRRLGIRYGVVIRALCVVAVCQLIVLGVGETYHLVTGNLLKTQSLVTTLVPSVPARIFFDAQLYSLDDIGWDKAPVPRFKGFYYWSPVTGTASLIISAAALGERNRWWQILALIGGCGSIWFAASRAAQVGVVVALVIAIWFRGGLGRRLLNWTALPLVLGSPVVISWLYRYFFLYRRDSATLRSELYRLTYQAFLDSPWFGYGSYGRTDGLLNPPVPLGSHSQVFSTLYHTGVLGSVVLGVAWIALSIALLRIVLTHPPLSPMLGCWVGFSLQMYSGELSAASITVFSLAAWLGCTWNQSERLSMQMQMPWVAPTCQPDPPPPWQSLKYWWNGERIPPSRNHRRTRARLNGG
jgi:hypothetical protein